MLKFRKPRRNDERAVEEFFEAVTDDDELPSGSVLSDGSDDSGEPRQIQQGQETGASLLFGVLR